MDGKFLLNQLFEIKKKENEIIQEFKLSFDKVVASVPNTIRPKDQALLIHYLNAFDGWLGYHLKEKNPTDLKHAQDNARKAEANVVSMGKQNLFDYYGPSSSKTESRTTKLKEPSKEPIAMLENMQEMVKNLSLITRDLERGREYDRYRNQYGKTLLEPSEVTHE